MATRKKTTSSESTTSEQFKVVGHELVKKLKDLVKKGNIQRIIIKDEKGQILMEIPVTVAAVAALTVPLLAAVGALAALVSKFTIEVIKKK
jgi:hypothetical protein